MIQSDFYIFSFTSNRLTNCGILHQSLASHSKLPCFLAELMFSVILTKLTVFPQISREDAEVCVVAPESEVSSH